MAAVSEGEDEGCEGAEEDMVDKIEALQAEAVAMEAEFGPKAAMVRSLRSHKTVGTSCRRYHTPKELYN